MEKVLQDFFNKFHQILGYDSDAARAKALLQVEKFFGQKCLAKLWPALNKSDQEAFRALMDRRPAPCSDEVVDFLKKCQPSALWQELFFDAVKGAMREYTQAMLKNANEEQKQQIREVLEDLAKSIS